MNSGPTKILIIEDDPTQVQIVTHILAMAGYEVLVAYGGEDAVRKATMHQPALVLSDLAMPGMSGVEAIERIKSNPDTSRIPVIAVTAHVSMAQTAGEVGCDAFVTKPFDRNQLLVEVGKFVRVPSQG